MNKTFYWVIHQLQLMNYFTKSYSPFIHQNSLCMRDVRCKDVTYFSSIFCYSQKDVEMDIDCATKCS